MKRSSLTIAACAALALGGAAYFLAGPTPRGAAAPSTASTAERSSPHDAAAHPADVARAPSGPAPTAGADSANSGGGARELAMGIERALVSRDARERDQAFAFLLPELMRLDPDGLAALFVRQAPGETRDLLRDEIARQWIARNRDAAVSWMKSLPEPERKMAATVAVRGLAASSPGDAIAVADEFGVGRDDGTVEHLVQIWAMSDPDAARRWRASQAPRANN